uniref:BACK domain-containing protein n=1 Tax=Panagrolaimus davidi TaxID=227884 RepID=A0A914QLX9_9BILA
MTHHSQLCDKRFELFKSQDQETGYFDHIYAHKFMLVAVSEVFKRKNIFIICKLNNENIFSMVDLSEFYQVKEFQQKCDEFLSKKEYTKENILVCFETLSHYSLPKVEKTLFKTMKETGINLVEADGFMETSKEIVMKIVSFEDRFVSEEKLFAKIFEWAENQVNKKKEAGESYEESLNLKDAIKSEMIGILPFIRFKKMSLKFLHTFVVKNGFLFSYDELSEILENANPYVKVKITNSHGKSIIGLLSSTFDAIEDIKYLRNRSCITSKISDSPEWVQRREQQIRNPSVSSRIKKRDGVEWYLYGCTGGIGAVRNSYENI